MVQILLNVLVLVECSNQIVKIATLNYISKAKSRAQRERPKKTRDSTLTLLVFIRLNWFVVIPGPKPDMGVVGMLLPYDEGEKIIHSTL